MKDKTQNIFYLTLQPPREGQASYVHVHEIIKGFKKLQNETFLYQPSYTKRQRSPALFLRLPELFFLQIRMWTNLRKSSVIYVRAHYLAFPTALFSKAFKIPIFHEINGSYEDLFVTYPSLKKFKKILIFMQKWQYKNATGLIAVTRELCTWANIQGNRNDCIFISNGANTEAFKPGLRPSKKLTSPYVIFFGGLSKWHGIPILISATKHHSWPEKIKLVIIGEGEETNKIKEEIKTNEKIIYLGFIPYEKVPNFVSNALAGLITISNPSGRSQTGVLPLKLYETLACAVPVIATDLPGQSEFVRNHACGYVIPTDDPIALAKSVEKIFLEPTAAKTMGLAGYKEVIKNHSWEKRAEETLNYIQASLEQAT